MQTKKIKMRKNKKEEGQLQKKPVTVIQKIAPPKLESTPFKAWIDENGKTNIICDPQRSASEVVKQITGTKDHHIGKGIIFSGVDAMLPAVNCSGGFVEKHAQGTNVIMQSLNDFKPKDAIEARLITQATVAYEQAMSLTNKGTNSQILCQLESLTNLAIKFMRVHNETIEALNRYRRGGEQKVTVTHIAEKMAVVNNYECRRGGVSSENTGINPCS